MKHWSQKALCIGLHSEMFFPPIFKEYRDAPESQYYALGKYVCEHCPVIEQCGHEGRDEEYGLWGGSTPKERLNGTKAFNKMVLPSNSIHVMPKSSPNTPIEVSEVKASIRPHLKRRPRNKG
jgi:hypothetical protein